MSGALRLGSRRGRLALTASILGSGMAFLDGTAVNVALPVMGQDLHAGFAGFQWVLNGYLVALASLVLTGGSLGDRWGRRRTFAAGAGGFALTSLLCALAPDLNTLIVARVLQGVAAALLVPTSLALVQVEFHGDDRGRAVGLWSGLSGITTLAGPLLGGWLADNVSWRAVFVLNLPLAAGAVWLALAAIPSRPGSGRRGPVDSQGAVMAVGMLGGLVFALTQGPEWGWTHPAVLAAGALAGVAALGFLDAERNHPTPMLPPRYLRQRPFLGANLVTLGTYFALSGLFFLLAIQLQRVAGYSAFEAGAATAPITLLLLVLSPLTGRLAGKKGPQPFLAGGPLVAAAGALLLGGVGPRAEYLRDVLPGVVVFGAGLSLTVAPVTGAALSALDEARAGVASGVNNAVARAAQLLAVPVLPLLAGISGMGRVSGPAFSQGYGSACRWAAASLAVTALVSATVLGLRPGTGDVATANDS